MSKIFMELKLRFLDDRDDGKRFPVVLVVAPVASAVTILLAILLLRWRMRCRIVGKFLISTFSYIFK